MRPSGNGCTVRPRCATFGAITQLSPPNWTLTERYYTAISLRDVRFGAYTERFQGLVPLSPHLCPLSVPKGGGMWGRFGKPLKRAIWNTLGLRAVLTTCLRFSSLLDDARVACCLLLSTGRYHTNSRNVLLLPLMHHRNLWCAKETDGCCSEFLNWMFCNLFDKLVQWRWFYRITWCVFIKGHSCNLCDAYVPNHKHGDVCPNGVPALVERGNNENESDSE